MNKKNVFIAGLFALLSTGLCFAGDWSSPMKGYIGVTLGPSVPVGDFSEGEPGTSPKAGLQFTMLHFGYLFSDYLGLSASMQGSFNPLNYDEDDHDADWSDENWTQASILAGPLLSFPISPRVEWDFRPMVGLALITQPKLQNNEQTSAFAYNLGSSFRFNVSKGFAFMITADYMQARPVFDDGKKRVENVNFGIGFAFRLR